jgi:hypothetical protein
MAKLPTTDVNITGCAEDALFCKHTAYLSICRFDAIMSADAKTAECDFMAADPSTQLEPCSVCLDAILNDAVMLVPCEHIFHSACLRQTDCPICRGVPTSTMAFDVQSWYDNEPAPKIDLSNLTDKQLWKKFVDEFNESVAVDDFKNGNVVKLRRLDGTTEPIRVPRTWTYEKLKTYAMVRSNRGYLPGFRLVVQGSPMPDDRLVDADVSGRSGLLLVHIIYSISGS